MSILSIFGTAKETRVLKGHFPRAVDSAVSAALNPFGFTISEHDKSTIVYRAGHQSLTFGWHRQEVRATVAFHSSDILPADDTLPDEPRYHNDFDLVDIFIHENLVPAKHGLLMRLNTGSALKRSLSQCAELITDCEAYFREPYTVFIGFRRGLVIRQLAYSWEMKDSYSNPAEIAQQVRQSCREFAEAWWRDGDDRSVANVLTIIENDLTPAERERLAAARERMA